MSISAFDLDAETVGSYAYATSQAWRPNNNGSHASQTIVSGTGRTGGKGLLIGFTHSSTEATKSYRAELQSYEAGTTNTSKDVTAESWLSVSYFFESCPPTDDRDLIIFQFHQGTGTPPVYLRIRDGVLWLSNRHYKLSALNRSTLAVTENSASVNREYLYRYKLCDVPIGEWLDLVIRVIPQTFAYPNSSYDGTLQIWVNGSLVVDITNDLIMHNHYNISDAPLLANVKIGQYVTEWASGSRLSDVDPALARFVTVDNIKWGTTGTVLEDLMPSGGWATSVHFDGKIPITRMSEEIMVSGTPLVLASYPNDISTISYPGSDASHARIRRA